MAVELDEQFHTHGIHALSSRQIQEKGLELHLQINNNLSPLPQRLPLNELRSGRVPLIPQRPKLPQPNLLMEINDKFFIEAQFMINIC